MSPRATRSGMGPWSILCTGSPACSGYPRTSWANVPAAEQAAHEYSRNPTGDSPTSITKYQPAQELVLEKIDLPWPLPDPR